MIFKLLIFFLLSNLFALENANSLNSTNSDFSNEINSLISHFTSPLITVSDLEKLLINKNEIMLLDAREKKEFEVSHIQSAINIGYDDIDFDHLVKSINKKKKIIIYCSIGYRSGKVADQLKNKGFNVFNLYGGLFEWSNKGKNLTDNLGNKTIRIHTYNKKWSRWISFGEKVY